MPNIKAKIKNVKKIAKANAQNGAVKSSVRTSIKKARLAVTNQDANAAELVKAAKKALDKAAAKGVIHQNNASRRAARLDKLVKASVVTPKA